MGSVAVGKVTCEETVRRRHVTIAHPMSSRNGQVDSPRIDIAEVMEIERGFVAEHRAHALGPEGRCGELVEPMPRRASEAVHTSGGSSDHATLQHLAETHGIDVERLRVIDRDEPELVERILSVLRCTPRVTVNKRRSQAVAPVPRA